MYSRKIYKYISVISFAIVVALVGNLILPAIAVADDLGNSLIQDNYIAYSNGQASVTINSTESYSLYWAKGDISGVDKSNIDDLLSWFQSESNSIADVQSEARPVRVEITDKTTIHVLCYVSDGRYAYASREILPDDSQQSKITITLEGTSNNEIIADVDSNLLIKEFKFASGNYTEKSQFDSVASYEGFEPAVKKKLQYTIPTNGEGTYSVYVEDTKGTNKIATITLSNGQGENEDKSKPMLDITSLSATNNSISIFVSASDSSGIAKYEYSVSEDNTNWSTVVEDGATHTFTSDIKEGTKYYVKAIVTDGAGNISEAVKEVETISTKDVSKPVLSITGLNATTDAITIYVSAIDSSGISKYTYSIAEENQDWSGTTEIQQPTHSYSGLKANTKYLVKVVATDGAGNAAEVTGTVRTQKKPEEQEEETDNGQNKDDSNKGNSSGNSGNENGTDNSNNNQEGDSNGGSKEETIVIPVQPSDKNGSQAGGSVEDLDDKEANKNSNTETGTGDQGNKGTNTNGNSGNKNSGNADNNNKNSGNAEDNNKNSGTGTSGTDNSEANTGNKDTNKTDNGTKESEADNSTKGTDGSKEETNGKNSTENKVEEDIPQTGSDNTAMITSIIAFSMLSIVSFIKYKRIR